MEIVCLFCDESSIKRHINVVLNLFNMLTTKLILCIFLLLLTALDNVHWFCKHHFFFLAKSMFLIIIKRIALEPMASVHAEPWFMPFPDPFRSNANIAITNTTNKGIGVRETGLFKWLNTAVWHYTLISVFLFYSILQIQQHPRPSTRGSESARGQISISVTVTPPLSLIHICCPPTARLHFTKHFLTKKNTMATTKINNTGIRHLCH